jgi:hypothetical protein
MRGLAFTKKTRSQLRENLRSLKRLMARVAKVRD